MKRDLKREQSTHLIQIVRLSMRAARRCVTSYSSLRSRHDFTQPQLLTCLVLRAVTKNDYRGVCELLTLAPALREAIGLEKIPHWTTLQKFMAKSEVPAIIDAMLSQILAEIGVLGESAEVATDSTGMQSGTASTYYQTRRGTSGRARQYVKLSLAVLCGLIMPAALVADMGPSTDMVQMPELMRQIERRTSPTALYADKGYDAEWVHVMCREQWHATSVIPPVIRTKDGTVKTHWRSQMLDLPSAYGRRWHVESFFSGLKRTTLSTLSSRKVGTMLAEASLKVLAYAIRR
jgi:hypothetical protein